jgi:phosphatidylinositol-3-phosphatase
VRLSLPSASREPRDRPGELPVKEAFVATRVSLVTLLAGLVAALSVLVGMSSASAADPDASVPHFDGNVFVIIGENTELGQINKSNAPFLIGQLKDDSAWLTNYFAVTHFSEANYAAMTAGQFTKCMQFDGSIASCHQNWTNIFNQLDSAGITWKSWLESMPQPCYVVSAGSAKDLNHYGAKHNPAIFYDNVEGAGGVWSADPAGQSAECKQNDIPADGTLPGGTKPNDMGAFNTAASTGNVARFNFIVPNECEDGHDNCKPQGNGVAQFDAFLAKEVPIIENSPGFQQNGLLIITFDEGTSNRGPGSSKQFSGGGNVVFAALGPLVQPGIYGNTYNHYSFLRTVEDGFGISEHPAGASTADPINTIWK